jgi:hypothetical protein
MLSLTLSRWWRIQSGWPEWANLRLLGDCSLSGYVLFNFLKVYINYSLGYILGFFYELIWSLWIQSWFFQSEDRIWQPSSIFNKCLRCFFFNRISIRYWKSTFLPSSTKQINFFCSLSEANLNCIFMGHSKRSSPSKNSPFFSLKLFSADWRFCAQGDQVGRIFAQWITVYFLQLHEHYWSSPHIRLFYSTVRFII